LSHKHSAVASGKRTTYFYAIFGITLVLLLLGIAGALLIEAKRVSKNFKENLMVEVVLKDEVKGPDINRLKTLITGKKYVKNVKFVSRDEAAQILKKDVGEDFVELLGYNPIYNSFHVNMYEDYTNDAGYEKAKAEIGSMPEVKQLNFQKDVLGSISTMVAKVTFVFLIVAVALLVFAISLIFNTIRLAMFSNRFTIKTMQLFGATRWFIIKPFLGRSLFNGFISGVAACLLLTGFLWYVDYSLPELALDTDLVTFALLFGVLILFGISISFFSTLLAVFRYLRLKLEDLY
jgi:cell division transport system permease protein